MIKKALRTFYNNYNKGHVMAAKPKPEDGSIPLSHPYMLPMRPIGYIPIATPCTTCSLCKERSILKQELTLPSNEKQNDEQHEPRTP